jgi:tetratricopeptide (TPR) repeat protein
VSKALQKSWKIESLSASKPTSIHRQSKFSSSVLALLSLVGSLSTATARAQTPNPYQGSIEVQPQSSFSRLRISLDESFKPVIQDIPGGFELKIPAATLMDIGVPFGGEEAFNKYLATVKDSRLSKLEVVEKDSALIIRGKYVYPTGPKALANPAMEHFDFRKGEQGKLVVDFWYKKGLTVAEREQQKKIADAKKIAAQKEELLKREADRKAAREKRMQEAKNALLFCEQPFDRKNTVFLRYHADHPMLNFSSYFPEHIPDHRFEYTEPKGDSEEAQMVRLALKLSRENKHALVVKTIEFLEKEYPKSKSMNEMEFLKANSFYRLDLEPKGRDLIQELAKNARGTEVGMQAAAFLAVQSFKKEEWLAALDAFMTLRREMPNHALNWLFRYGIAECLYRIRQSDQARTEFEWVAKNAPKAVIQAEAAFKVGDVAYDRNQFAQAIQAYIPAVKKYESSLNQYPHVLMNLAESYFQLDEYKKSEDTYKRYLEVGRSFPEAWRASLRLAEIHALNQKHSTETEKAFTETINRYPMTPGTVIARLRLLPCGNHGGFDLGSAQRFLSSPEVKNFDEENSVYTSAYKELVGLTEVRTLLSFGQDEKAIEQGIVHLRENPTIEVRKLIETAMIGGIKRKLEAELNTGDGLAAIATYEKYGDYLPLASNDPMADELRIRLAQYASDKKFTNVALKLIEPYRRLDTQLSDSNQKELLAAIEKNLTLESSVEQDERNYLDVKTRWNGESFKVDDSKQADEFLAGLASIRDQSKYAWDRDLLKALFYVDSKDPKKALELAMKLTAKMTQLKSAQKAQVWSWAGDVAKEAEDAEFAAKAYHQARMMLSQVSEKDQAGKSSDELNFRHLKSTPSMVYLYTSEGEMLERQQKWKEAVALYTEAIENKVGGNHVLYAHARALLKEGSRDAQVTASRSLEKIKQSQDDDVWKSLAQKALDEIAKEGKVDEKRKRQ